jgi:hypothetical protein
MIKMGKEEVELIIERAAGEARLARYRKPTSLDQSIRNPKSAIRNRRGC